MKNHKHYELCYRAHQGTSYSPDKRAESACTEYDADIQAMKDHGCNDAQIAKYDALFVKWMSAKSRCISVMITGAGNFPTLRNAKANESERKHGDALLEYFRKVTTVKKESDAIKSNDPEAIEKLKTKISILEQHQELMKVTNRITRSKKTDEQKIVALIEAGFSESNAQEMLNGEFKAFELINNNANIKRYKARLEKMLIAKSKENADIVTDGYKVVENTEIMRYQIIFDEKPSSENIAKLKKRGFKWAPSQSAWQRQITANGKCALDSVLKELEHRDERN